MPAWNPGWRSEAPWFATKDHVWPRSGLRRDPRRTARIRTFGNVDEIVDFLDNPSAVEALLSRLDIGSRLALCLFALTETTSHSLAGLTHTLGILGAEPTASIVKLLELGLLVIEPNPDLGSVDDFQSVFLRANPGRIRLLVHPGVANGIRTARPDLAPQKTPAQSARFASRTGSNRSSGWAHSGNEWDPSRFVRPSRAPSTSVIATESRTTRSYSPDRRRAQTDHTLARAVA